MQTTSKTSVDIAAHADASNEMPEAKVPGKMVTRSAMKSQRSSVAADATASSVAACDMEADVPDNSSVKDFDPMPSPDANKTNLLDSDAKVFQDAINQPEPAAVEEIKESAVEEKKESTVELTKEQEAVAAEPSKEAKGSEGEAPVVISKKRTLAEITGGD